jgi:DNA-binding NtrC family response regulator
MKYVVIEEEESWRKLFAVIIGRTQNEVTILPDAAEAHEYLKDKKNSVDFLICDGLQGAWYSVLMDLTARKEEGKFVLYSANDEALLLAGELGVRAFDKTDMLIPKLLEQFTPKGGRVESK